MRFCVPCQNWWVVESVELCLFCELPGERGVRTAEEWGLTRKKTVDEMRAMVELTKATGGKP